MPTREDFINFHCPRYEEFPSLELYAEQVISLVREYLSIFSDGTPLLTSNMINNYVKQKIVKPPVNKKYDRVHLSYFVAVCLMKGFMNISELCSGFELLLGKYTVKDVYNIFCDELESALRCAFIGTPFRPISKDDSDEIVIIRSMCTSFANLTLVHFMIEEKQASKS